MWPITMPHNSGVIPAQLLGNRTPYATVMGCWSEMGDLLYTRSGARWKASQICLQSGQQSGPISPLRP